MLNVVSAPGTGFFLSVHPPSRSVLSLGGARKFRILIIERESEFGRLILLLLSLEKREYFDLRC